VGVQQELAAKAEELDAAGEIAIPKKHLALSQEQREPQEATASKKSDPYSRNTPFKLHKCQKTELPAIF
jgi:hypothetical protein